MQPADAQNSSPATPQWRTIGAGSSALLGALSFAVTILITFFLSPFILRRLGDASYGLLSVTWELGGYFGLFDLGLRSAINYYVSRSAATGALHEVRAVVRNAFWLLAAITLIGLLASWPLAFLASGFIQRGPLDFSTVRSVLWLGIVVFSLNLTGSLAGSVLAGLRRFDWLTFTNITGTILTGVLVFASIQAGMGLFAVAFAQATGTLLPWVAQQFLLRRWQLTTGLWPPRLDRTLVSRLTSYGSANLAMRISELLAFQSEQIIIVQALGPAAVAQYHVGRYLALHSRSLVTSLCMVLAPYFTALSVREGEAAQRDFFLRINRWICAPAALLLAGVLALGKPFLVLWVGARYTTGDWWNRSDIVLAVFACAMAFRSLTAVPYQFLLGTRRLRFATTVLALEAAFIVVGGTIAVRWKGIVALAFVKLASCILISVVAFVPYTLRELRIPISDYLRQGLGPALLVGAATSAVALLMRLWLPLDNWPRFFLIALLSAACGATAFLSLSTAEDREFLLRKLRTPLG